MPLLSPEDYIKFPSAAPDHRYRYGSHGQQFGDLYLPSSTSPHSVIVLVHGGGYREMYDLKPMGRWREPWRRMALPYGVSNIAGLVMAAIFRRCFWMWAKLPTT